MPFLALLLGTLLTWIIIGSAEAHVSCNDAYPSITNLTDCTTLISALPVFTPGPPHYTFPAAFRYRSCLITAELSPYSRMGAPYKPSPGTFSTLYLYIFKSVKEMARAILLDCDMLGKSRNYGYMAMTTVIGSTQQRTYKFRISVRGNPNVASNSLMVGFGHSSALFHNYWMDGEGMERRDKE